MQNQNLVMYKHPKQNLFYIGMFNVKTSRTSSSLVTQINRAKYLYRSMMEGKNAQGLKSGFMMALINTNYEGWTIEEIDSDIKAELAAPLKVEQVQQFLEENDDWHFVGSDKIFVKGERKDWTGYDASWNRKWNVANMKKEKINEKIDFILKSIAEEVPKSIYLDAYMCTVIPGEMGRRHNFEPFELNDLVSLYKYVRTRLQGT